MDWEVVGGWARWVSVLPPCSTLLTVTCCRAGEGQRCVWQPVTPASGHGLLSGDVGAPEYDFMQNALPTCREQVRTTRGRPFPHYLFVVRSLKAMRDHASGCRRQSGRCASGWGVATWHGRALVGLVLAVLKGVGVDVGLEQGGYPYRCGRVWVGAGLQGQGMSAAAAGKGKARQPRPRNRSIT